jgi:hypothetical protein
MKKYLILLLFVLVGCASRKVDRQKTENKETVKIDSTVKIIEKETIKIDTKKDIEESDITYTPIDNKLEFIINGKTYKNVQISHKKKKDNTIVIEDKIVDKKQDIAVIKEVKHRKNEVIKKIDKKANYFVYLWLLLIPVFYVIYKRFTI